MASVEVVELSVIVSPQPLVHRCFNSRPNMVSLSLYQACLSSVLACFLPSISMSVAHLLIGSPTQAHRCGSRGGALFSSLTAFSRLKDRSKDMF